MTPATYSRGGVGTKISYATAPCPLGRLLVAQTARGICRVSLGNHVDELAASLRAEFPPAEIRRQQGMLPTSGGAILRHLNGERPLDLPLDGRATALQRRRWGGPRRLPHCSHPGQRQGPPRL